MKNKNLGFAKWYRRGVEGVSKVKHGSARWGQGVIWGVEVRPGQPVGQVSLEPLHLLLLLLEEQLCSNQTFISCPLVLPTGARQDEGWCQNSCVKKRVWKQDYCLMCDALWDLSFIYWSVFFVFSIKEILKSNSMGIICQTQCVYTQQTPNTSWYSFSIGGKQALCAVGQIENMVFPVSRHSNSRQFSVMPEIREIGIVECGCHIRWPH